MKSLSTQAIFGAVSVAVLAALGSVPPTFASLLVGLLAAFLVARVAFAAQSERLRGEGRLVYRPVYVRRHDVQRRVSSDG